MPGIPVILGVGGGIAAYKSAELARALDGTRLRCAGRDDSGCPGVHPSTLTFAALTGRKVITGMFTGGSSDEVLSSSVEHIGVARDNRLLIVAPATADLLARFAQGLANDFLTTSVLGVPGARSSLSCHEYGHVATSGDGAKSWRFCARAVIASWIRTMVRWLAVL